MEHSLHLTLDGDNELTEICGWRAWDSVSGGRRGHPDGQDVERFLAARKIQCERGVRLVE